MKLDSAKIYTAFANHDAIISIYGMWPSFHGAELTALRLDTKGGNASIEADLRVLALGHPSVVVTLRFDYVDDVEPEDWEHQNVLEELEISYDEDDKRFEVELSALNGCSAEFTCVRISVVSVTPQTK